MPTLIASLLRKAALLVLMLLALSLAVFYISRLTPGDPLQSYYGDAVQSMSSAELDAARQRLGLDGPIWEQYQRWAGNVLDGDFGMSLKFKRPVVDVVRPLLGNTLLLGGLAYALVFVLAIALALGPRILLADEPTGALDSKSARLLLESLEALNRRLRATVLMVTHDSFAASCTSRVLFIRDGKIFTGLRRGDTDRREFFDRIMEVVAMMGGEGSDAL